jgi:hypothetical protein
MGNKSGLYIYCIMNNDIPDRKAVIEEKSTENDLGIIGLRNQLMYQIKYKDLSAVVSNFPLQKLNANIDDIMAHQKAVETLRSIKGGTVLPVRFGTVLRNEAKVSSLLSEFYDKYKSKLIKVKGKNEFGIKVLISENAREKLKNSVETESEQIKRIKNSISSLSTSDSGSDYLLKLTLKDAMRNELFKKLEHFTLEIHQQFVDVSVDSVLLKADVEQMILNAAYLVDQGNSIAFESKVIELREHYRNIGLIFHLSGPWAPYSFC